MTRYLCGIDIGGTFTDCVLVDDAGKMVTCKVPSTPDDFARGMIAALEAAAARTEQSVGELCASISVLSHGTTTGTNTSETAEEGDECPADEDVAGGSSSATPTGDESAATPSASTDAGSTTEATQSSAEGEEGDDECPADEDNEIDSELSSESA